jgi:hypothetical protein
MTSLSAPNHQQKLSGEELWPTPWSHAPLAHPLPLPLPKPVSRFSMAAQTPLTVHHGHMARGGHRIPIALPRPTMPYPSTPCGRAACSRLLPLWTPRAVRLCLSVHYDLKWVNFPGGWTLDKVFPNQLRTPSPHLAPWGWPPAGCLPSGPSTLHFSRVDLSINPESIPSSTDYTPS